MFYVIYNSQTGQLLDICTILPDAQEEPRAIAAFDSEIPDLYFYRWSTETRKFEAKSDIQRCISVHQFLNRFTAIERITIKTVAKDSIALADYMDMLNSATFIDLDDKELFGGLSYLAYLGLIDQARITEILG